MADREFWIAIRSALLAMVAAIDRRYALGKYAAKNIVPVSEHDNIAGIVEK